MPGIYNIITFILSSEFIVVFPIVCLSGMYLNGHIAARVEGIVIIEPNWEETAESTLASFTHDLRSLGSEKGIKRNVNIGIPDSECHADFHRNKIKYPGDVFHTFIRYISA